MNKIDDSNITPSVLQPFTKTTWDYLQGGIEQMLLALAKCVSGIPDSYGSDVVLFGCANTSSASWAISEGWIYDTSDQHQELFYVFPFNNALDLVGGQVPVLVEDFSWDSGDPIKFTDGNFYNVHAIRALKWQMGTPGSGIQDFGDLIILNTLREEEDWHYVGAVGEVAFATGISNYTGGGTNSVPLRYKKTMNNKLIIEGHILVDSTFRTLLFTITDGDHKPNYVHNNPIWSSVSAVSYIQINPDGTVDVPQGLINEHAYIHLEIGLD